MTTYTLIIHPNEKTEIRMKDLDLDELEWEVSRERDRMEFSPREKEKTVKWGEKD